MAQSAADRVYLTRIQLGPCPTGNSLMAGLEPKYGPAPPDLD